MIKEKCICGDDRFTHYGKEYYEVTEEGETVKAKGNNIKFGSCESCGIIRQLYLPFNTKEGYIKYYDVEYPPNDKRYKAKDYTHDKKLAKARVKEYGSQEGKRTLDVGSGSGAFVDLCREKGENSFGCEVAQYDYGKSSEYVYRKLLEDVHFPTDHFDRVTCHDVLEHTLDPGIFIKELFRITQQGGSCIVDFPRFFKKEGKHHWKQEHIWFFNEEQLKQLLTKEGFTIAKIKTPIPSKVVFYLTKPQQNRVKVLLPPGIGDSYWSIVKMKSFLKDKGLELPDILIACNKSSKNNGHLRAFPFLEMFPFIKSTWEVCNPQQHPGGKALWLEAYRDQGRTLFNNILGCDYFLSYNGHLAHGESLEDLDSQWECDWFPDMFVSLEQERFQRECKEKYGKYLLFYFVFHGTYQKWTAELPLNRVADTMVRISQKFPDITPLYVGATWDKKDHDSTVVFNTAHQRDSRIVDLRGQTSVEQLFGMIKGSECVVGYPSGLTLSSAMLRTKTLIIWNHYYNKDFHKYSCAPELLDDTYFVEDTNGITSRKILERVEGILN